MSHAVSLATADPIVGRTAALLDRLFPPPRAFAIRLWNGFEVRDVENLREHYALTLRHWAARLEQRRAEAIQLTDEVTYRTWRLFLTSSAYGFESGNTNVNQTLLAKPAGGKSSVPLTRADLYA